MSTSTKAWLVRPQQIKLTKIKTGGSQNQPKNTDFNKEEDRKNLTRIAVKNYPQ